MSIKGEENKRKDVKKMERRKKGQGRKEERELLTLLPEAKEITTEPVSPELRSSISREQRE